jgi:hypothetical protein
MEAMNKRGKLSSRCQQLLSLFAIEHHSLARKLTWPFSGSRPLYQRQFRSPFENFQSWRRSEIKNPASSRELA